MRAVLSGMVFVLAAVGCDAPPTPREELARFCQVAQEVRAEEASSRSALLLARYGDSASPPMQTFLARLAETPPDERWAFTFRFANEHGQQDWRCPALEEIFETAAPK